MAEVVALTTGPLANRRVAFHNLIDEVFDARLAEDGVEPEALVVWMGGLNNAPGASSTRWTMFGEAYAGATATLAKAVMHLHNAFLSGPGDDRPT